MTPPLPPRGRPPAAVPFHGSQVCSLLLLYHVARRLSITGRAAQKSSFYYPLMTFDAAPILRYYKHQWPTYTLTPK